jgi:hypothetical protein
MSCAPFFSLFAVLLFVAGPERFEEEMDESSLPAKARTILEKAEQLELYSLDPVQAKKDDSFRGWKVLGKTTVKGDAARKQIVNPLLEGIAKSDGGARCFIPRHGIRATFDGKTVDLVICFECSWVYVFYDKDEKRQASVATAPSPQPSFDGVLAEAKVALPKPAKK